MSQQKLQPPVMAERTLGPATEITGGTTHTVTVGESSATLFIPDSYKPADSTPLWIHFHTADWFIVSEYQRAAYNVPVLNFNLGQGSTVYAKPFFEKNTLHPFLRQTEQLLKSKISDLNFTSFSAGYGAVRQLIQDPEILAQLKTVIFCDSIYASLDPAYPEQRTVLPEHLKVWQPLIDRALAGKATVVMTTSQITPETYAGTWEVVKALVELNGGTMQPADPNSAPAKDPRYPLLCTFNQGEWYVWSYEGNDATAHMTHPRRLAEILQSLRQR